MNKKKKRTVKVPKAETSDGEEEDETPGKLLFVHTYTHNYNKVLLVLLPGEILFSLHVYLAMSL